MFFFLSKILAFLIAPYTWLFFGLIFLLKKLWHTSYKKWVLGLSVFIYVISNSFIVDEVVRAWEYCDDDIYLKAKEMFDGKEVNKQVVEEYRNLLQLKKIVQ